MTVIVVGATILRPVLTDDGNPGSGPLIAGAAYDVSALTVATALAVYKQLEQNDWFTHRQVSIAGPVETSDAADRDEANNQRRNHPTTTAGETRRATHGPKGVIRRRTPRRRNPWLPTD